jgi:CAI-1 autoinducer synthase
MLTADVRDSLVHPSANHTYECRPEIPEFLELRIERKYRRRRIELWREHDFFRAPEPAPGCVALDTNDYLGIGAHPEVTRTRCQALLASADPTVMSDVFLPETSLQRELERRMASFWKSEAAILCQSGWAANVGLMQAICDPATPVYIDQMTHMSLWEGAHAVGAPLRPFRHNDPEHLARRIAETGPGIVIVDSVYSTNGSVAPLAAITRVARAARCVMVVDESHSLGTMGPEGSGLVCELGIEPDVLFRTASLSKAFGARGGLIGCPSDFVDYFRTESHVAIFSSAVHSYEAAAFLKTLEIVRSDAWRRQRLHENARRLRAGLRALGYAVDAGTAQIVALECGSEHRTLQVRDALLVRGVSGAPFLPPATGRNHSVLRLTPTCALRDLDLERSLEACREIRGEVELASWPSTQRQRARQQRGHSLAAAANQ